MLTHEWNELELLCDRIGDLRDRQRFARRGKNVGLAEALKADIVNLLKQREHLVQHISARLGSVAAEPTPPVSRTPARGSTRKHPGKAGVGPENMAEPMVFVGFDDD